MAKYDDEGRLREEGAGIGGRFAKDPSLADPGFDLTASTSAQAPICGRCGGPWGEDLTCQTCCDADGNARPVDPDWVDDGSESLNHGEPYCEGCGEQGDWVVSKAGIFCPDCEEYNEATDEHAIKQHLFDRQRGALTDEEFQALHPGFCNCTPRETCDNCIGFGVIDHVKPSDGWPNNILTVTGKKTYIEEKRNESYVYVTPDTHDVVVLRDGSEHLSLRDDAVKVTAGRQAGMHTLVDPQDVPKKRLGSNITQQVIAIGGPDPHAADTARIRAAAALIKDEDAENKVRELAGKPVTVMVMSKPNSNAFGGGPGGKVEAWEGKPFVTASGDLAFLPKGARKNGYNLTSREIVAVETGYGKQEKLANTLRGALATVPTTYQATCDDLTTDERETGDINAAYLFTAPIFDRDQNGAGAVFLASDVTEDGNDPIVNGVLVAPPNSGLTSEHGSFRLSDLKARGGRVRDYRPGSLTFDEALEMTGSDDGPDIRKVYERIS